MHFQPCFSAELKRLSLIVLSTSYGIKTDTKMSTQEPQPNPRSIKKGLPVWRTLLRQRQTEESCTQYSTPIHYTAEKTLLFCCCQNLDFSLAHS